MEIETSPISDEAFSSIDLVCQCLIDPDKATAFEEVFKSVIKSDYRVLDLGTGSGILALLAARAGAKEVTAVEFDPFIADVARNNIKHNGYADKIKVISADARTVAFSVGEKFDVIAMEMLSTGLVDEFQIQAINNLCEQGLITSETILVPSSEENYFTLAEFDFSNYGFEIKMVRHLWSHDHNDDSVKYVSDKKILNFIDFSKRIDENFSAELSFVVTKDSKLNSVCLSTKTFINKDKSVFLESTHSLNPLVVIPLPDREVHIGDDVRIGVSYKFGGGYQNFKVNYLN